MTNRTPVQSRPGAAREKAQQLRLAQERKQAARRRRTTTAVVVVALVAVLGLGVLVQSMRQSSDAVERSASSAPTGTLDDGTGVLYGSSDAPVTVEVYEDFLCPACGQFEQQVAPALASMVDEGTVKVVYRPMAFLDRYSTNRYSTRALNAAACAADEGGFQPVHDALFAAQPAEGGPGPDDDALVALAERAGVTGAGFEQCVRNLAYEAWTEKVTEAAFASGVQGTPTVVVNGETLPSWDVATLDAAVDAALASKELDR